jgi:hypothetical protein
MLHKLQLISGRLLFTDHLPPGEPAAQFVDLAIAPDGTLFALDGLGRRVVTVRRGAPPGEGLQLAATVDWPQPVSLAPMSSTTVFVAHGDGIGRAELRARSMAPLKTKRPADLTGIEWMRWHRGSLLAVQRQSNGLRRIVRIRLDGNGGRATRLDVLERDIVMPGPSAAAISGDTLFYLTTRSASPSDPADNIVRRITIR